MLALVQPADSFIDDSLSGHFVSAANDDTVAITKSVRDEVPEGLSDGDLAEFEAFRCVRHDRSFAKLMKPASAGCAAPTARRRRSHTPERR